MTELGGTYSDDSWNVLTDPVFGSPDGRYVGHNWRDMSHYLVHLTDDRASLDRILEGKVLEPGPRPCGFASSIGLGHPAVSLSEIPHDDVGRLAERQGSYGVVFHVSNLLWSAERLEVHFARVWYVERDSEVSTRLWHLAMAAAERLQQDGGDSTTEALAKLAPFIDVLGDYNGVPRRFEWEREWRWIGELPFCLNELRLVIAPASEQAEIHALHGVPVVDVLADRRSVQSAIQSHQPTGAPSPGWNACKAPHRYRIWHDGTAVTGTYRSARGLVT
jgi:hypothetical protein